MILEFNDEEKESLLRSIDNLKILKHLQLLGYTISPMQFATNNDDMLSDLEDFAIKVIEIILGHDVILDYVLPSKYDLISLDDDEGYLITEMHIHQKDIAKYLQTHDRLSEMFNYTVNRLMSSQYSWYADYSVYEVLVKEDNQGLTVLCSDFLFFDFNFVEKLTQLINYCAMENQEINKSTVKPVKQKSNKSKRRKRKLKKRARRR